MNEDSIDTKRKKWIGDFVKYVIGVVPTASVPRVASKAERLYPHLGEFGPIEVAQAEWEDLPIRGDEFSN